MKCAKCEYEMTTDHYKGVDYDHCKNCGGMWFDALEAEELVEHKNAGDVDIGDAKEGAKLNKVRDINCPVCNVSMTAVHDVQQPHIQLEACPKCYGAFFDAGEFKDFCEETFMDRVKDWLAKKQ